jgi:hypothetical protein
MGIVPRLTLCVLVISVVTPRPGHLICNRWQISCNQDADKGSTLPAQTYVDLSLDQLITRIPELKGLQQAEDQKELPMVLAKMGHSVDTFMQAVGDLIADEDVIRRN